MNALVRWISLTVAMLLTVLLVVVGYKIDGWVGGLVGFGFGVMGLDWVVHSGADQANSNETP